MRRVFAVLAVLALVAAACGDGAAGGTDRSAIGPGITVSEAIESDLEGPLLVNGYLVVDADGRAILAESLAESFPPQPGGATLEVEGLELDQIDGLASEGGVSWTEQEIQLLGSVEAGVLTLSGSVSA